MSAHYRKEFSILLLAVFCTACGGGADSGAEKPAPEARMRQQTGLSALHADTATSLMDTRPPINKYNTPYLFPHEHPDLPEPIADWLSERGYVIPQNIPEHFPDQLKEEMYPVNVVRGEFARAGQTDYAVLSTDGKKTCIFVFWNATVDSFDIIDKQPWYINREYKFTSLDMDCCSFYIWIAKKELILRQHDLASEYADVPLPPIEHDGIDYGIYESGSNILYYSNCEWIVLPGAD
ncbi:MAG: hypothetical protein FVQ81_08190 [Candidatus Glassbacteria bacterium]|nr:hypothetical protein [Candidatus Glassbacteria bacterium]